MTLTYKPQDNPRYLGPDPFDQQAEAEESALERSELAKVVSMLSEALDTFNSPGWQHIAADLHARHDATAHQILAGSLDSRGDEDRARGRILALRALLDLPSMWTRHRDQLLEELSDLDGPATDADTRD